MRAGFATRMTFCALTCVAYLLLASQSAIAAAGGGWHNHVAIYGWLRELTVRPSTN